ncbi:MAG TPA: Holliday junction resolvase RuvX [Casimicrobiaceae bacterium]|nr:Holliday junction resolvase RuvX [Casimicrobiaceae bacterium]
MTSPAAAEITVLAFDFGTRRIGVAVGNTLVRAAHALATIDEERTGERFARIAALVDEWQPGLLVVGVPVHADGSEHPMTQRARRFARQLEGRFRIPVREADERHTTEAAADEVRASRAGRRGRDERDAIAARLILQGWFDEHRA